MITVIVPTCSRPELLQEALSSISRQTALQHISSVVVSENGMDRRSLDVTNQFPQLPIAYRFREPPLLPLEHGMALAAEAEGAGTYVAILHDDDWWDFSHLQNALDAMDKTGAIAVFSNNFVTLGPRYPYRVSPTAWLTWLGADCDFGSATLTIDAAGVLLSCLLDATFHYSTLVGRSTAVRKAVDQVLGLGNVYDNDRTFPVFLAMQGTVAYLTRPDVFVRRHAAQDSFRAEYIRNEWELKSDTTQYLATKFPEHVCIAASRFNAIVDRANAQSPPDDLPEVYRITDHFGEPHRSTLVRACGFKLRERPGSPRNVRWLARQLCPPALINAYRRTRGFFAQANGAAQ
jgi:Glycosyl transferase family 2